MQTTASFNIVLDQDVINALVKDFDYMKFRVYVTVPGVPEGKYVKTYCEGKQAQSVQVNTWTDLYFRKDSGATINANTMKSIDIYFNEISYTVEKTNNVITGVKNYKVVYYDAALSQSKKTETTTIDDDFDFRAHVQTFYLSSIVYGKDATAPAIAAQDTLTVATGETVDLNSLYTVSDNFTATDKLTVSTALYKVTDEGRTAVTIEDEFTEPGNYVFVIEATDANGNAAKKEIAITVTGDTTAPVITKAAETAELWIGEKIDYTKWFTVTDNTDPSPKVTTTWSQNGANVEIGDSISSEGDYVLTVTATDAAGNTSDSVTLTVKVVASKTISEFTDNTDNSMIFPLNITPSNHTSTNSVSNEESYTDKNGVTESGLLKIVADNASGASAAAGMLGIYLDKAAVAAMGDYDYVKLRLLVQNNALAENSELDSSFLTVDFSNQKTGGRLNKNVPLNTWVDFYVNKADLTNVSDAADSGNVYNRRNVTVCSMANKTATQVVRYSFDTQKCSNLTAMNYCSTTGTDATNKKYGVESEVLAKLMAFTYYIDEISYGVYAEDYDTTVPTMPSLGCTTEIDFSGAAENATKAITISANVYDDTTNCITSFELYEVSEYTDASNYTKGDSCTLVSGNKYTFTNKADGSTEYYVIVATATDNAGNITTKEFIVTVIHSATTEE